MPITQQNRTNTCGFAPLHLLFDERTPLFKLIGRTNVFLQIAAGPHPIIGTLCVQGVTLDNRFATTAREADIVRFN